MVTGQEVRSIRDRLAARITVDDGFAVVVDAFISLPSRLVALDGVDVLAAVCVCDRENASGSRVSGTPLLTVDVLGEPPRPNLLALAWSKLGVPERWLIVPAERTVSIDVARDGHFPRPERVTLTDEDTLDRTGPGWRCHLRIVELFPPA